MTAPDGTAPNRPRRRRLPAADALHAAAIPLVALLAAIILALLIWLGVRSPDASGQTRRLLPLLQDQAIGALSVIVLGLVAALYFRLRYTQAKRHYLKPFFARPTNAPLRSANGQTDNLADAVDSLVQLRPPRSLLAVSPPDSIPVDVVETLAYDLVDDGLTPVVVEASRLTADADLPAIARESFVARVSAATGDEPRAHRMFERELQRGRVIILVTGLEQISEAKPRATRRAAITALLQSCLLQGTPFIAAVTSDLAPALGGVAVVRTDIRVPAQRLCEVVVARLKRHGLGITDDVEQDVRDVLGDEPAGDPWLLTVAADVVVRRIRNGEEPGASIRQVLVGSPDLMAKMAWLSEHALDVPLDGVVGCVTPAAEALALLGRQVHHREEFTTSWGDVTQHMSREESLRFSAGVTALRRKGVLVITGDAADPQIAFAHREWLIFAGAVGIGVEAREWTKLLAPAVPPATLEALVEALVLPRPGEPLRDKPLLDLLKEFKGGDIQDVSLDMIISVVTAVQMSRPLHVREDELRILRGAWRVATDPSRLLFLSTIEPNDALAMFLWEQVVPPEFQANSFRVRRAIALTLARMGPTAWAVLAPRWSDIVQAAQNTDLSPLARVTPHWRTVGVPLASLSWILPGVVASLSGPAQKDGRDLLRDTVAAVAGAGRADGYLMEPGLEISLAEGFKMAATVVHRDGHAPPWQDEAVDLLEKANSWVSRLALQQCITLCGWADGEANRASGPPKRREHPFVREATALARRTDRTSHGSLRPEREIWLDDVEALQDGGYVLSPAAHRLLGLSTLLIDLCEGMAARATKGLRAGTSDPAERQKWEHELMLRVTALTAPGLPRCFTAPWRTMNMVDGKCTCDFQLCGRATPGSAGHRIISRSFAERAQRTAGARLALGRKHAFVRGRFAEVWRHIWERTPLELSPDSWDR